MDSNGYVYVADSGNHRIRTIAPNGDVKTLAGSDSGGSGFADGAGTAAKFNNPVRIAVGPNGNVYVADLLNYRIRKITPDGVVSTLDTPFNKPYGVDVDAAGNVYVADRDNNLIRKIGPDGVVVTIAGSGIQGSSNGPAPEASFKTPQGVVVDANGTVYVSDFGNQIIRKIAPSAD